MEVVNMELTEQQAQAIVKAEQWACDPNRPLYIAGYAGTGKTSVARHIVASLGKHDEVVYAAFTGKAVHVLRNKGCEPCATLHSLIYTPKEKARAELRKLKQLREAELASESPNESLLAKLEATITREEKRLAVPDFILRTPEESTLRSTGLVVVDEISMVGQKLATDLLSFHRPVLVLGDPMQLPPVGDTGWLTSRTPDHLLTEVHRSAWDSPVTRIATTIRLAQPGSRHYGVTGEDGGSGRVSDLRPDDLPLFDQVLCGTNATRWQAIATIRAARGHYGPYPQSGDRIIILANNGEAEVLNGQQYQVSSVLDETEHTFGLLAIGDDGPRELSVWKFGFTGTDGERRAQIAGGRGETAAATFADAITVHKAQGSQWPTVLLLDESYVFSSRASGSSADRFLAGQQWMYTGATRAMETLAISSAGVIRN